MRPVVGGAIAAMLIASGCSGPQIPTPTSTESTVKGTPFIRGEVSRATGSMIHYYFAPSPQGPRPLLVVLQGSGCGPLFEPRSGDNGQESHLAATSGQDVIHRFAAGRFAVLVVEKPGVRSEASPTASKGSSDGGSPEFRRAHSLAAWSHSVSLAIDAAKRDARVDVGSQVRLLGISEGAITAARVARERDDVSHVAFISGFGCDQWRDMLIVARRQAEAASATKSAPERTADVHAAIEAMEHGFRGIASDPTSADRLFAGQTYLYWSTFGRACPADDLARTSADVFVAYGTADEQVDPSGIEAIPAARIAAGKPVTTRRVIGGSHVLDVPGDKPFTNLLAMFKDSLDWMDADRNKMPDALSK